jgi:hypothetical protein
MSTPFAPDHLPLIASRLGRGHRLGDSSPALTLSSYSHVLPRQQSAAAAAFAQLVDERRCADCGGRLGDGETGCQACESKE